MKKLFVSIGIICLMLSVFILSYSFTNGQDNSPSIYKHKATVINKTLTNSNSEYSQVLPNDTRQLILSDRAGTSNTKVAFNANGSGTTYFTVKAGSTLTLDNIDLYGKTVYMQSPTAGTVMELLVVQDE